MRLEHIGYAVDSIEGYCAEFLRPLFGDIPVSDPVEDPLQRVRVAFAALPGGRLELVEPLGEESPVGRILSQRRGGLYHLCYAVDDLEAALARLRELGALPVSGPTPAAAFGGRRVAFLFTRRSDLIELVEEAAP